MEKVYPRHHPRLTLDLETRVRARAGWSCEVCEADDRLLLYYVLRIPADRPISTSDVCVICDECKQGVLDRTVGIAGDANRGLSITDAREDPHGTRRAHRPPAT